MYFDELALSDEVLDALWDMHFDTCTPVQEQTIPVILEGHDVISCAQTGTGKTAAYILPLLTNLQYDNHDPNRLNAIIMAPTRELAQQIDQQMEGFGFYVPFSSVAIYGGNASGAWGTQVTGLQRGADIIIATPGRLLSQMNIYDIDFSGVKYFILDEADRMLDMGFYDDIMTIVNKLPKDRQTILFSATMPANIRKMAKAIMHNPVEVQIAISRPPESIRQMAVDIFETQKTALLVRLLGDKAPKKSTDFSGTPLAKGDEAMRLLGERQEDIPEREKLTKVIIFVGKKQRVKDLTRALRANHINARAMHSDLEQKERDEVMLDFRNGKVDVLVATDIVSRGIDVDDIPLVINYDVPHDAEDYVHRIGRTARAANKGEAITLISPEDKRFMNKIERFLKKTIDRVALPDDLGPAPDSSVCSLAADERKPSSKRRKGGWHGGQNRKPKKNRSASHKQ